MDEQQARRAVVDGCRRMNALGINQGTSGNVSIRNGRTMLISPSGVPCEVLEERDIAAMAIDDSEHGAWRGPLKPSTEWRFHRDIMLSRPEVNAVVHSHPTFCTALAIARREIPACHYMIAAFGGANVRCAPYATFGTRELAGHALHALQGRKACLLANHGMIVCAGTIAKAMWLAVELETVARQYYHSLLIGGPVLLTDTEIAAAIEKFATYGPEGDAAA